MTENKPEVPMFRKEHVTRAEFEEFKTNLKGYLDHTEELIKVLTKAYEDLCGDYKNLHESIDLLNTKINIIAESEGLVEKETIQ
jgi:uncharacterized membrane-anchored protein YhcB (DUF1043 family)